MTPERRNIHALTRQANGPGRVEFLFDREASLACDIKDEIGHCLMPRIRPRDAEDKEGLVLSHNGKRYRVRVVDRLANAYKGFWIDALPWPPKFMPMMRDPHESIDVRASFWQGVLDPLSQHAQQKQYNQNREVAPSESGVDRVAPAGDAKGDRPPDESADESD